MIQPFFPWFHDDLTTDPVALCGMQPTNRLLNDGYVWLTADGGFCCIIFLLDHRNTMRIKKISIVFTRADVTKHIVLLNVSAMAFTCIYPLVSVFMPDGKIMFFMGKLTISMAIFKHQPCIPSIWANLGKL